MNGVIGISELLLEGKLDPTQKHHAKIIANSARSLLAIIDDILDFSKIEAGKLDVESTPFNLYALLDEIRSIFQMRASQKQLGFELIIEDGIPEWVIGDPTRLRQILNNFLSNAFKFTQKGSFRLQVSRLPASSGTASHGEPRLQASALLRMSWISSSSRSPRQTPAPHAALAGPVWVCPFASSWPN
jgi:signal transduction histidine kinase